MMCIVVIMRRLLKDIDDFIEEDIDGDEILWKKRSILFDLPY